jgi:hypothetical protein
VGLDDQLVIVPVVADLLLEVRQLVLRELQRGLQAHQLSLHLLLRQAQLGRAHPLAIEQKRVPHGDAGTGADSLEGEGGCGLGAH